MGSQTRPTGLTDAAAHAERTGTAMKQSLRKTPTQLHLAYKYGDASDRLIGRNCSLLHEDTVLTMAIDLSSNFQLRNKTSAAYLDAINFVHNHKAAFASMRGQPGTDTADPGLGKSGGTATANVPRPGAARPLPLRRGAALALHRGHPARRG